MTTFEDEVPSQGSPKKHFSGVPKGIASFTDQQIDVWAEKLYDQMARDLKFRDSVPADQFLRPNEGESMKESLQPKIQLTDRFITAVAYAMTMHREQTRKSTDIPYICHPFGVASLVIEASGDEDQAIGALLHDVAEDCGGEPRLVEIREKFGPRVEHIVRSCSDSLTETEEEKASWRERKAAHLKHLRESDQDMLIVTAADKLHNARAIATDLQTVGVKVWDRFNADPESIVWYYNQMLTILTEGGVTPKLLNPLASAIELIETSHE